jgi:phosphate transport system ATP-binding protein
VRSKTAPCVETPCRTQSGLATFWRKILFDEPCSALDPLSTAKIEELIADLRRDHTIAIVTHNIQEAARLSDFAAFMYLGELIEFDATATMFVNPRDQRTRDYVHGRFG